MMILKAQVLDLSGKPQKQVELPSAFDTVVDPNLIKRAVLSIQSGRLQPKGNKIGAGRQNTAVFVGVRWLPASERSQNIGHARLHRLKNRRNLVAGRVAKVPQAVGGPRAHPPKVEKKIAEFINKKEKKKALWSAIAATGRKELVQKRGHVLQNGTALPLVVENKFEELTKTKDVTSVLKAIKVYSDIENAKTKKRLRPGKGKLRGRKYKRKKSVLIVTGSKAKLYKGARNLEGVDVVQAQKLNAELLAPGANPGRLTVWTENALHELTKKPENKK